MNLLNACVPWKMQATHPISKECESIISQGNGISQEGWFLSSNLNLCALAHHLASDGLFLKQIISVVGFRLWIHKPLQWFRWEDGKLCKQAMGGKIKNFLCQVCHQSNCFLNYILEVENKVVWNCLSTNVAKYFWHVKWKCCGVVFKPECLPSILVSPKLPVTGWYLWQSFEKRW